MPHACEAGVVQKRIDAAEFVVQAASDLIQNTTHKDKEIRRLEKALREYEETCGRDSKTELFG